MGKLVNDAQSNSTEVLPFVMSAYHSAPQKGIAFLSNFLHFGRQVRAPIDLILDSLVLDASPAQDYEDIMGNRIRYANELVREQLNVQAE